MSTRGVVSPTPRTSTATRDEGERVDGREQRPYWWPKSIEEIRARAEGSDTAAAYGVPFLLAELEKVTAERDALADTELRLREQAGEMAETILRQESEAQRNRAFEALAEDRGERLAAAEAAVDDLSARLAAADAATAAFQAISQRVHALFSGGPDTSIRTTWDDGVEYWEVPANEMRAALDGAGQEAGR